MINSINKIIIKNFRKFEELTIDFSDSNLAVFHGRNGTGKTSILEAINLAFFSASDEYLKLNETDFYCDEPIEIEVEMSKYFFLSFEDEYSYERLIPCKKFKKTFERRTRKKQNKFFSPQYKSRTNYDPEQYGWKSSKYSEIKEYNDRLTTNQHLLRTFRVDGKDIWYKIASSTKTEDEKHHPLLGGFEYMEKVLYPRTFYFGKDREKEILGDYNTAMENILSELDWRFRKEFLEKENKVVEKYENLEKEIESLDKDSKLDDLLEPVRPVFEKYYDGPLAPGERDLKLFFLNYYAPYISSQLGVKSPEGCIIPASNLGSGISILISLLLSVSYSMKTKEPGIMLIDEPEMHLHSDTQKLLLKEINEHQTAQFIAATHSHIFIKKDDLSNNFILDYDSSIETGNKMNLFDLQYRILGNDIADLVIPKNIVLVEGKYDKKFIYKCLAEMGYQNLEIQVIPVGGKSNMPNKSSMYQACIERLLNDESWYSSYLKNHIKIIVDNDVSEGKIDGWVDRFDLNKESQIKHISEDGMEYLFPEILVRNACDNNKSTVGGDKLSSKDFSEIIDIILKDDSKSESEKQQDKDGYISKQRLNEYVREVVSSSDIDSGSELHELIEWIVVDIHE